jgi:hypothetical protein
VFVLFDHREQLLGLVSRNFAASILEVEADRFAWSLVGTVAAPAIARFCRRPRTGRRPCYCDGLE